MAHTGTMSDASRATRLFSLKVTKLDGTVEYDFRRGESVEKVMGQIQTMLDRARGGVKAFASMADWQGFELREA